MPSGGNKKTTKNTPKKSSNEKSIDITMKKNEEMLEKKFKSYKENIKKNF